MWSSGILSEKQGPEYNIIECIKQIPVMKGCV